MQADRHGLASTGQPLQHLRRQLGQPQLPKDMVSCQSNDLGQFLERAELTDLHVQLNGISDSKNRSVANRRAD